MNYFFMLGVVPNYDYVKLIWYVHYRHSHNCSDPTCSCKRELSDHSADSDKCLCRSCQASRYFDPILTRGDTYSTHLTEYIQYCLSIPFEKFRKEYQKIIYIYRTELIFLQKFLERIRASLLVHTDQTNPCLKQFASLSLKLLIQRVRVNYLRKLPVTGISQLSLQPNMQSVKDLLDHLSPVTFSADNEAMVKQYASLMGVTVTDPQSYLNQYIHDIIDDLTKSGITNPLSDKRPQELQLSKHRSRSLGDRREQFKEWKNPSAKEQATMRKDQKREMRIKARSEHIDGLRLLITVLSPVLDEM